MCPHKYKRFPHEKNIIIKKYCKHKNMFPIKNYCPHVMIVNTIHFVFHIKHFANPNMHFTNHRQWPKKEKIHNLRWAILYI